MRKIVCTLVLLIITLSTIVAQKERKVIIKTNYGKVKLKLYNETPKHRDNFVKLAKEGFYNGTLFHRVIPEFMIQGGDPDSKNAKPGQRLGSGGLDYTVPAEFNPKFSHKKGALAAARTGDQANPQKASSSCQFYIVVGKTYTDKELDQMERGGKIKYTDQQRADYKTIGGTPFLDQNYTVYGEVTKGMEIIDKIAKTEVNQTDRPKEDIVMLKVKVK